MLAAAGIDAEAHTNKKLAVNASNISQLLRAQRMTLEGKMPPTSSLLASAVSKPIEKLGLAMDLKMKDAPVTEVKTKNAPAMDLKTKDAPAIDFKTKDSPVKSEPRPNREDVQFLCKGGFFVIESPTEKGTFTTVKVCCKGQG